MSPAKSFLAVAERLSFFAELKRRNVLRAGALYTGAIWAMAQGISQLSAPFGMPNWVTRWFVIAGVIGFPLWLAFAWFYEFTPQGIKRESDVAPDAPSRHSTARKLDFAIIGVLALAVVLLGSGYFVRSQALGPANVSDFTPPEGTLVVLPFKNLSGDPKQQYFSDGITEELTDALGRNPALRVIAWDTASKYHSTSKPVSEIGRALNVANVLHGSIEREGGEVRISVELVNAVTGYATWSHHYDNSFANIFAVQDHVSQSIASALQVQFTQADLPAGGTRNPEAHDLVLKSLDLMGDFDAASLAAARSDLQQAIVLDPGYADAHAILAQALLGLTEHAGLPLKTALPMIRAQANKALALDPRNATALVALGLADDNATPKQSAKARAEFLKALALDPSNEAARTDYGLDLPVKPAQIEDQEVARLDPDALGNWNNLAVYDQDLGDWPQMVHATKSMLRLKPTFVFSAFYLAFAYQQMHQYDKMVQAFDQVSPSNVVDKQQISTGRLVYQAVRDPRLRTQAFFALKTLMRAQSSNEDVAYNVLQMYLALGQTAPALPILQRYCQAVPVACSDLAINPAYMLLRTDPRFQQLAKKYTTVTLE